MEVMKVLVNVIEKDNKQSVNARDLHTALWVKKDFSNWIKGRIEKYGFESGEDFVRISGETIEVITDQNPEKDEEQLCSPNLASKTDMRGGHNIVEYILTMQTAKELAMVENNEKGREIRRYLIKVEEAWNSPEMLLARVAQMYGILPPNANKEIEELGEIMARTPFPGSPKLGIPQDIFVYKYKAGGRIYRLKYDGYRSMRILLGYDHKGRYVGQSFGKVDKYGYYKEEGVVECLQKQHPSLQGSFTTNEVRYNDYYNWKISLIKEQVQTVPTRQVTQQNIVMPFTGAISESTP